MPKTVANSALTFGKNVGKHGWLNALGLRNVKKQEIPPTAEMAKAASIKLATSRVHGTGLFTNVDIKQGTKFARAMVRMRGKDAQSRYELTKAARYTNHSQVPSAQMVKVGNEIYLVALKAIPADTEVLVDYRKTASVLGPGSYITFKGKKRTTWNQLEKQAQQGVSFALKQADMLKDLGEGIAKGVEGLAGQVGKSLDELKEVEEEKEKEQEKLDKAVARNVRERKARKLAKKYAALATYGVDMGTTLSTEGIQASGDRLRRLLQWRPEKKKKKKRSGKNYEQELNLQEQRTVDKLLFEEERHNNLMKELELRQMLAKTGGILPEEGPIANILEAVGAKKSKSKKEEEAARRKAQYAAQVAADAATNVKMGAPIAKKRREFAKGANQAVPQGSYANTQPSPTAQRQGAHDAMNAQAAGAGSQQPPLTPEDSQVLGQRPQATPSANQRPLNPTVANLGAGPLTGDQFGPGAQSGLGMALTASARSQGDLIDMALRCIEKRAYGGSDEDFEYDRYLDMGVPYVMAQNPKRMAAFTQAFADSAKQQGAELGFTSQRHAEGDMTPEQAIEAISNYEGDLTEAEDDSLPYYYTMKYPRQARKGLLQHLRLRRPEAIEGWPAGHPWESALKVLTDKERKAYKDDVGISVDYDPSAGEKNATDAGYAPDANKAGGKVKGFPKTLPGVPQVPAWGSDKSTRMPKDTLLGPAKAQSQAKKQFPAKEEEKEAETPLLPGPFDLAGTAIAGGIGGAGIGALINAVRGRSLKRGLITGGLTGAGTLSGHELGSNLSRNRAAEFAGGWGGTGAGGYGGYQLAQYLQGPEEEKKKKKRAKKASADPLEFVLSITKSSAPTPQVKQRRKGAPRSVTIKKPSRVCPDTGKVTPGSSFIKHIARTGKKIK